MPSTAGRGRNTEDFFGKDNIHFAAISSSLPNVTRNYYSFSQAARDNSLSRIYAGYHSAMRY